ncbi:MAG TPA: helical backbone metal receptor [Gemmatimonadales bacterium]|nr:helical backbone metal receptor [Gemmatimonadales bacterium]
MGLRPHRPHLAGVLLALAACRGAGHRQAGPSAIVATDDAGRRVALAAPARRVVSLSPAVTELLFALGAGDRVVGRTHWCDYPPQVSAIPDVGDGLNPNVEAVSARKPDLVVLYRSPMDATAAEQFDRMGVASALVSQDRIEDLARAARLLGALTGRAAAGDSIADALGALLSAPPPFPTSRVAFVVWDNPPMVIGAGSYLDQLATLAGARNVFHDLAAPSATVSLEVIAQRDPDAIVVLSDSGALPSWAHRPEWRTVRAVREGRIISLAGSLFARPSPRAALAAAELRRRLEGAR